MWEIYFNIYLTVLILNCFIENTLAKNTTRVLNIYSTYTNQRLNLSTTIEKRSNNIGEIELRVTSQEIVNQSLRISSKKPEKFESYFMRQHNFQTLNVVILSFNFKFILDEIKRNSLIL